MRPRKLIATITSLAVIIAMGDMPYGYYTLLRLMLCGFSLFLLFGDRPIREVWQRWVTGGWAVLYNPVLPIHLGEKDIWTVLNVATACWFWFLVTKENQPVAGQDDPSVLDDRPLG